MFRRLIIGLGCGRCGTASLASLLCHQPHTTVTHEGIAARGPKKPTLSPFLQWEAPEADVLDRLMVLGDRRCFVSGDVAYYYLPHVTTIAKAHPGTRFVCLKRERELCIRSLMSKCATININPYQNHNGPWAACPTSGETLPKYDGMSMLDAVGKYYDDYYEQAKDLFSSDFRVFDTECLNTEYGVQGLLDFCGYTSDEQVVQTGIRTNVLCV